MIVEDYQRLAMRTSPEGHDRMLNGCMGLIGESGEVVDIVKKWKFQSGDHAQLPKAKLIEELGDVLWYCAEVSTAMGVNMMDAKKHFGIEGLAYDGQIHIEAIFLSKMANDITDDYLGPDVSMETIYKVAHIIDLIEYMLNCYCECTLADCMQLNIDKLKRRYPDGFDPERSLHREG